MDKIITLYEKITTENAFGEEIVTWIELVKVGSEIATGTLTAGVLYQVTATEEGHFGTGVVIYDTFTAAGDETCDASNKVKPVTLPATVWAERLELRGNERWSAQQIVASMVCKYHIRYRDDVTAQCMVIDDAGREYDIQPPLELGRREGLELICSARSDS
ncbi:MAG: phage head closure protein [Deltaproteobacteria bacterium]|nr:phage head closure protein [Deltaproteobacteria bacterium]